MQNEPKKSNGAEELIARQALSYIEERYDKKLRLMNVAAHCYVSQWYLSKLLHKALDKNFCVIINELRIGKAKELLMEPGLTIAEIGEIVGFSDTAYFSRVFKRLTGISIREYRNCEARRDVAELLRLARDGRNE